MRGRRSPDADIDLGLAISGSRQELDPSLTLGYGETRTFDEIAAYCGVDKETIQKIYRRAMRKLNYRAQHLRQELMT